MALCGMSLLNFLPYYISTPNFLLVLHFCSRLRPVAHNINWPTQQCKQQSNFIVSLNPFVQESNKYMDEDLDLEEEIREENERNENKNLEQSSPEQKPEVSKC